MRRWVGLALMALGAAASGVIIAYWPIDHTRGDMLDAEHENDYWKGWEQP